MRVYSWVIRISGNVTKKNNHSQKNSPESFLNPLFDGLRSYMALFMGLLSHIWHPLYAHRLFPVLNKL